MSTKPSYDYSEDDDTGDDHDVGTDGDGSEVRWLKSSSVLDNLSQYDNFTQFESPAEKSNADKNNDQDESLLSVLSDNTLEGSSRYADDERHLQNEHNDTDDSLLQILNGIGGMQHQYQPSEAVIEEEEKEESLYELLNDETKDTEKDRKYKDLNKLQLQLELESVEEAIANEASVWKAARGRSDYESIPAVKRVLDSWYGPLTEAIELEQWLFLNGDNKSCSSSLLDENGDKSASDPDSDHPQHEHLRPTTRGIKDRTVYGPLLCLLPARKIAVILAHTAFAISISGGDIEYKDMGSKVVELARRIAEAMETEVNISRALRVRAQQRKENLNFQNDAGVNPDGNAPVVTENPEGIHSEAIAIDRWVYTATHLQRFLDDLSGEASGVLKGRGRVRPAKVQKRCKEILLAEGFTAKGLSESERNRKLSMNDFAEWDPVQHVKLGAALICMLLDHTTFSNPQKRGGHSYPEPAFRYVRKQTGNKEMYSYISLHPDLLNIAVKEEFSSTLSVVSPFPSMKNSRVQPMVVPPNEWTDFNSGGYETIRVPFMRTRHCKTQMDSIRRSDLSVAMEGLNVLGKVPWKINQKILDVALKCWEDGIVLGDIPSQVDHEVPPLPESLEYRDWNTLADIEKSAHLKTFLAYKERLQKHNRFKQKNMDLHSLRCSAMLKLNQAVKFREFEEIFFPFNIDFRGRAYPVPPHLSTVGSDLCRGLLTFAEPKALGENGLYWLKVHLANLAGADKMSFDGRAGFADDNMDSIRAAVNDPFGDDDWWKKFDDPFQGLATCHEIVQAIDSGAPENYMCSLPVHMDGSCNGLQHYAALGRDRSGGKAVNLCIADEPQDVYIGVMHEVIRRVAADADEMIGFDENSGDLTPTQKASLKRVKSARLVNGLIDRGVVKRTVMTSVYGVTFIGAKTQISEKIKEKLEEKGEDIDELEQEIHTSCGYLASMTMEVMGQQFKGARQTMNWLTECARLIAAQGQPVSFISPIGVPVVQPYRQKRSFTVVTLLQNVTLTNDSDLLPLHRQRQVSAFPPNYVHSLDSSHMLLTAIEMQKQGLHFSAVHDSYWTHACDIEKMNSVLRESFIELYNRPLLEELKQRWEMRYPSIPFPDIPDQGDLDLNDVRSAPYFFQ